MEIQIYMFVESSKNPFNFYTVFLSNLLFNWITVTEVRFNELQTIKIKTRKNLFEI